MGNMGKRKRVKLGCGGIEYLGMSDVELRGLPAFDAEGGVIFYDVGGGYLLGKEGLIRWVESRRVVYESK
jgi:hypothetical protein